MSRYYEIQDDLTGAVSRVALPVPRHVACHRCGGPSGGTWYCRPCCAHLSRRDWLPVLIVGVSAGLLLIVLAVLMVLGVAR